MSDHVTRYNFVIRCLDGGVVGFPECSGAGQYVLWHDYQNLLKRLKAEEEANLNLRLDALKDPTIGRVIREAVDASVRKALDENKGNRGF